MQNYILICYYYFTYYAYFVYLNQKIYGHICTLNIKIYIKIYLQILLAIIKRLENNGLF